MNLVNFHCRPNQAHLRKICQLFLLLLLLVTVRAFPAENTELAETTAEPTGLAALRVAIVYSKDQTGNRQLDGATQAIDTFSNQHSEFMIETRFFPYLIDSDFEDGLAVLGDVLSMNYFHFIVGPTDSDVYNRIETDFVSEDVNTLDTFRTPIISPVIVSTEGNSPDDWRFRTNVNINTRMKAAYNIVNSYGHRNIAVLFDNSEFGTLSEAAFRINLTPRQQEIYISSRYETLDEIRAGARWILQSRPSAIGIFGPRADVAQLMEELSTIVNDSIFSYRPLVFSPIDVRTTDIQDVRFVSVMSSDSRSLDDIFGLSYDTTLWALFEASQIVAPLENRSDWSTEFRSSLLSTLRRPPQDFSELQFLSGMSFQDGNNSSDPKVLYYNEEDVLVEDLPPRPLIHGGVISNWFSVRDRQYGIAPIIGLVLVVLISIWLTVSDVKNWRDGYSNSFSLKWPVIKLMLFNVISALAVVIVAAETKMVSWLSIGGIITITIGYRALLKSTLIETSQGQAIGLGRIYDGAVESIQNSLMKMKYKQEGPPVNYIAYTNTPSRMRRVLENVYSFANSKEQTQKLVSKLDVQLDEVEDIMEKRKVYARFLISHLKWPELVVERMVPKGSAMDSIQDPLQVLADAADYCFLDSERINKVSRLVDENLEAIKLDNEVRFQEKKESLEIVLAESATERGRFNKRLEWLLIEYCFDMNRIRSLGFLPDLEEEADFETEGDINQQHVT